MTHFIVPEAALALHQAVVGLPGSGKTYAAKGIVERLLEQGRRCCIIDPTGAWWGVRSSADGEAPGFPVVVFGGDHADVPIATHDGARLGELIARGAFSTIIDLSDLLIGQRHRFMTDFLEALHHHNRKTLHLIADEADEIAPQRPLPETTRLLHQFDRIVRRGRIKGFRVMMITQRPAVLNKNVLSTAQAIIAMSLTSSQDRDALHGWIEGQADKADAKAILAALPGLATGEGYFWAPKLKILERVTFPPIRTFDSSRTPEHDEDIAGPAVLAPVELAAIRAQFGAEEEPEPAGADDSKAVDELRVKVADLKAELEQLRLHAAGLSRAATHHAEGHGQALGMLDRIRAILDGHERKDAPVAPAAAPAAPDRPAPPARKPPEGGKPAPAPGEGPDPLRPQAAPRKLLSSVLAAHPLALTWRQAATLSGLKARGGQFNSARKLLRERGLVEEDGDRVKPTEAATLLAMRDTAGNADGMRAWWRSVLPTSAAGIFDYVVGRGPKWITKATVAGALNRKAHGGQWNSAIAELKANELIEAKRDEIRAAPGLWTEHW